MHFFQKLYVTENLIHKFKENQNNNKCVFPDISGYIIIDEKATALHYMGNSETYKENYDHCQQPETKLTQVLNGRTTESHNEDTFLYVYLKCRSH